MHFRHTHKQTHMLTDTHMHKYKSRYTDVYSYSYGHKQTDTHTDIHTHTHANTGEKTRRSLLCLMGNWFWKKKIEKVAITQRHTHTQIQCTHMHTLTQTDRHTQTQVEGQGEREEKGVLKLNPAAITQRQSGINLYYLVPMLLTQKAPWNKNPISPLWEDLLHSSAQQHWWLCWWQRNKLRAHSLFTASVTLPFKTEDRLGLYTAVVIYCPLSFSPQSPLASLFFPHAKHNLRDRLCEQCVTIKAYATKEILSLSQIIWSWLNEANKRKVFLWVFNDKYFTFTGLQIFPALLSHSLSIHNPAAAAYLATLLRSLQQNQL